MKGVVLMLAICLLASCATMKNAENRPTEGDCIVKYDSAKIGEKEILAGKYLVPGGMVAMEVGFDQADAVRHIIVASKKYKVKQFVLDYNSIQRIVVATKDYLWIN